MSSASPTFREALRFWLKLGFISFGGPAGQIAIMQTELVERKKWIASDRFLHALNFCMLLPGPEAQQLATYCGWLLHGTRGGLVAGTLFVLPAAVLLWALSWIYVTFGQLPAVTAVFDGLKSAVLAIILAALLRIARKTLRNATAWSLAALAFALLFFAQVPFPLIVGGALVVGFVGGKFAPGAFGAVTPHGGSAPDSARAGAPQAGDGNAEVRSETEPTFTTTSSATLCRAGKVLVIGGALWAAPLVALGAWQGWHGTLVQEGVFFSKAAMVTFGGAYAVLPYVGQQAVETYGWLTAPQMLDGLAFAETTPGPLIMVLQFVGFMGGWNHPGALPPLVAATLGAAITTWVTFVPCFVWIFLGAPHVERLRGNRALASALAAVTASVVGVILNLAVWFGWHTIAPDGKPINAFALVVAALAFAALHWGKVNLLAVIAACGAAGWLGSLL